jgi:hypothetical protein
VRYLVAIIVPPLAALLSGNPFQDIRDHKPAETVSADD